MRHHGVHVRAGIAAVAVVVLIAAHSALLTVVARAQLSIALLAAMAALLVLKYAWRRARR